MILKYLEFLNEAKSKDKNSVLDLLFKLLKEKPTVKLNSKTFPDEKGAYTLAGIKKYFKDNGLTTTEGDDALYYLSQDKERKNKVKNFKVKNFSHNESYPYYYMDLTKEEIEKIKNKLEKDSTEMAKPEIEKRKENKKRLTMAEKEKQSKKPTTRKK